MTMILAVRGEPTGSPLEGIPNQRGRCGEQSGLSRTGEKGRECWIM